jgi:hypothetical protein
MIALVQKVFPSAGRIHRESKRLRIHCCLRVSSQNGVSNFPHIAVFQSGMS